MSAADPQITIAALERKIESLRRELVTDELTQILNRRGLMESLDILHREVAFQLENPEKRRNLVIKHFSVLFLDIDHFHDINTRYGHDGGDAALRLIAQTIKSRLRGIDVVGRYGGEEIVVGLVGADRTDSQNIAEQLRETVAATDIVALSTGKTFRLTVSIGVAVLEAGLSLDQLLKNADKALYKAKHTGRNRVVMA